MILLTGATGYIGQRLLPLLVKEGHQVLCAVRDQSRLSIPKSIRSSVSIVEIDFLNHSLDSILSSLQPFNSRIQAAYYLLHSMSSKGNFEEAESRCAQNFTEVANQFKIEHVLYLSGIVNETNLSKHLNSRLQVETILEKGEFGLTTFRAGIIIGSGSASFEIIRDLVEKLPVMIAPKWLHTKCQPIAIRNVLEYLTKALLNPDLYHQAFDIGGPNILTYKEMLLQYAQSRNLKRFIGTVPIMTPRLSSYWLYFVTSTSYPLAINLVDSMKIDVIARPNSLSKLLNIQLISYPEALDLAFDKIQQHAVISSWKDAQSSGVAEFHTSEYIEVPKFGCFKDKRMVPIKNFHSTVENIWKIGGTNGWYYATWLWKIRGILDKLVGGVGLRRGRTHENKIEIGDAIDFWRVLYADKEEGRLLLFAEMKLPGDAWLEFKIVRNKLMQVATFRPKGLSGRIYWFLVLPFHEFIFRKMAERIAK